VNLKGSYYIYGPGGEVRLRHERLGNPVKRFDCLFDWLVGSLLLSEVGVEGSIASRQTVRAVMTGSYLSALHRSSKAVSSARFVLHRCRPDT
jgi:hypothetical protein